MLSVALPGPTAPSTSRAKAGTEEGARGGKRNAESRDLQSRAMARAAAASLASQSDSEVAALADGESDPEDHRRTRQGRWRTLRVCDLGLLQL